MQHIQILDQVTIDKIAAGEVVERPASVVKELVENAMDAGADTVTVEIEEGGISLIRITDNGSGISKEDIRSAFLRHSTSKIRSAEDLVHISTLGFRGEALSSIAAVSKMEAVTKPAEEVFGLRYTIEGGKEVSLEKTGAPDGTVFTVRQLFYNVPARRKFLRTAMTEAGHIQDLLMRLALSHPQISFCFLNNGQERLRTSGSGKLDETIYQIYGREVSASLLRLEFEKNGISVSGYIGRPEIVRGNRNFETFFVNGRYIKNNMISKALEDAYKDFIMQHKFPFAVLHFQIDPAMVDVNVHPTKMELRFQRQQEVYNTIFEGVHRRLLEPELIPQTEIPQQKQEKRSAAPAGEMFKKGSSGETKTSGTQARSTEEKKGPEAGDEEYFLKKMRERVKAYHARSSSAEVSGPGTIFRADSQKERFPSMLRETPDYPGPRGGTQNGQSFSEALADPGSGRGKTEEIHQMELFEEKFLKRGDRPQYQLIGQIFETYWLVQFGDNLYIIDQHAAHERVLYERTLKGMRSREFTSQYISPPIILDLTMQEEGLLKEHMDHFTRIGYEIEPFGERSYAVRAVPGNLFGIAKKGLLLEMLDMLSDGLDTNMTPDMIDEKIASMSCKAAVKGNSRLSAKEMDALIGELLLMENPYHCPHGRPTIIAISKKELEKKFKRIL